MDGISSNSIGGAGRLPPNSNNTPRHNGPPITHAPPAMQHFTSTVGPIELNGQQQYDRDGRPQLGVRYPPLSQNVYPLHNRTALRGYNVGDPITMMITHSDFPMALTQHPSLQNATAFAYLMPRISARNETRAWRAQSNTLAPQAGTQPTTTRNVRPRLMQPPQQQAPDVTQDTPAVQDAAPRIRDVRGRLARGDLAQLPNELMLQVFDLLDNGTQQRYLRALSPLAADRVQALAILSKAERDDILSNDPVARAHNLLVDGLAWLPPQELGARLMNFIDQLTQLERLPDLRGQVIEQLHAEIARVDDPAVNTQLVRLINVYPASTSRSDALNNRILDGVDLAIRRLGHAQRVPLLALRTLLLSMSRMVRNLNQGSALQTRAVAMTNALMKTTEEALRKLEEATPEESRALQALASAMLAQVQGLMPGFPDLARRAFGIARKALNGMEDAQAGGMRTQMLHIHLSQIASIPGMGPRVGNLLDDIFRRLEGATALRELPYLLPHLPGLFSVAPNAAHEILNRIQAAADGVVRTDAEHVLRIRTWITDYLDRTADLPSVMRGRLVTLVNSMGDNLGLPSSRRLE